MSDLERKVRILVVDDEEGVRDFAKSALEGKGYEVDTASDGLEAIRKIIDIDNYDLILSDIALPGMNGDFFCRIVRNLDAEAFKSDYKYMPIILMSGHSETIEPSTWRVWKADGLIAKPFDIQNLYKVVEDALRPFKILYIDDDDLLRTFVPKKIERERNLRLARSNILVSSNGEEGYETYQRERPDIVIVDREMPKLDGYGVIRKIRQVAGDSQTPIIMFSGGMDKSNITRAIEIGANSVIQKPDDDGLLIREIKTQLRLRQYQQP